MLESSLWVLWLPDSPDSYVQCRRGLQYAIANFKAGAAYRNELAKFYKETGRSVPTGDWQGQWVKKCRGMAAEMGLKYDDLRKTKPNLTGEMPNMKNLESRLGKELTLLTVAEWRRLSGYEHGKYWSVILFSDRTVQEDVSEEPRVILTASGKSIDMATEVAQLVFIAALELYIERCEQIAEEISMVPE